MIRTVTLEDAGSICEIYNHYILYSVATFEETPLTADKIKDRICRHPRGFPWIVYEEKNNVLGYAYATKWHTRSAYRHSVESTVYVSGQHHGRSIGKQLYTALIRDLADSRIHCIVAGISLPNQASVSLHQKFGFEKAFKVFTQQ